MEEITIIGLKCQSKITLNEWFVLTFEIEMLKTYPLNIKSLIF